ncbi:sulfite exporter TauE/SafE family protein [Halioxenophilus sp. WMMB6]|uniref:sulfite exporter TauE/SafE family protein n=1 Tax=Halioxenophilus sp. WMMB6 TaxID=3073815 RepID=UPI00295F0050|nr:sulfite exporter TauE/SafE family protein [Halioxenophilus sp. WMMB6]
MLADLSYWQLATLTLASFFGSLMSAALGVGGGSFLIMVMANILPPLALIPVHGVVQLGSNSSRAWLTRKHRENSIVGWFILGAVLATFASVWLLNKMDPRWIPVATSFFILYLSWGPMPKINLGRSPAGLVTGGLATTIATMLVGASGPLVSAWLGRDGPSKWHYTANFSTCMVVQHLLKILAFGFAGFVFTPWLLLLGLMLVAAWLGTRVGLKLLDKLPEKHFKIVFRWLLTLLALRILFRFFTTAF